MPRSRPSEEVGVRRRPNERRQRARTDFRAAAVAGFVARYGQEIIIAAPLVALFVGVGMYNPRFLGRQQPHTIFSGNAYIAVAAIGMSMVIITGNIDVSVGALIGVLATISGTCPRARRHRLADAGSPAWVVPILGRHAHRRRHGVLVAYLGIPADRRDPRHVLHPEGRPDQRRRRRLDQRPAARLPVRRWSACSASRCRSGSWSC